MTWHLRTDNLDRFGGGPSQMLEWARLAHEDDELIHTVDRMLRDDKTPSALRIILRPIRQRLLRETMEALESIACIFNGMVRNADDPSEAIRAHARQYVVDTADGPILADAPQEAHAVGEDHVPSSEVGEEPRGILVVDPVRG